MLYQPCADARDNKKNKTLCSPPCPTPVPGTSGNATSRLLGIPLRPPLGLLGFLVLISDLCPGEGRPGAGAVA